MSSFPIRCPLSASTLSRWQFLEEAAWEDAGRPEVITEELIQENYGAAVHIILERHKNVVEVHSPEEIWALKESANFHGDPEGWEEPMYAFRAALRRFRTRLIKGWA